MEFLRVKKSHLYLGYGILFVAICLLSAFYTISNGNTIYRTDFGFFPKEISITLGEQVVFKNISSTPMWPASNIHPSHTVNSEFDPRQTIDAGESWSYTFTRRGVWGYHDHIATQFIGTVTVSDEKGETAFDCEGQDKKACWAEAIEFSLENEGVTAAFETFTDIHQKNPEFASGCHTFVHEIGLKAYLLYGTDVELTPKTSYCNAGFFHGYMEGFISNMEDSREALEFCQYVGEVLREGFPFAEEQCRHGIGHGLLEHYIVTRPDLHNNPKALTEEAIALCEETNETEDHLMRCVSGIFNVFRDFMSLNKIYDDVLSENRMYTVCSEYSQEYVKEACYWELSKTLTSSTNMRTMLTEIETTGTSSVYKIASLIPAGDGERYIPFSTRSWAFVLGKYAVSEFKAGTVLRVCDTVPEVAKLSCLRGIFEGAFSSSEPHQEYTVLDTLCQSTELNDDERTLCYEQFQADLYNSYAVEEFGESCSIVPPEYKSEDRCN